MSRPSAMVGHLDLVVGSMDVSLPFYLGLLEPLGWRKGSEIEGEHGQTITYLTRGDDRVTQLGLREKLSDDHAVPYERRAIGLEHICFEVSSREVVEERAEWVRGQDAAEIFSEPAEHTYMDGYYAFFFTDPDGIKLEVMHHPNFWEGEGE